ncbi:MAG: MBL fold metallo-hydrolase [Bacteroidales bacterium]|nr:MBL fold metallo-hydrolase [Bacteroidales bacterium]
MIKQFVFNHFQVNTFVLYDKTGQCVIIDAGCNEQTEKQELFSFIESNNLSVKKLLLTHAHLDHFCGMADLARKYNIPITMHENGKKIFHIFTLQAQGMNFQPVDMTDVAFEYINYGKEISFGDNYTLKTLNASGHCPGSIAYYSPSDNAVFVGDAVFRQTIGRTDLFGGDLDELVDNINNNIMTLPLDTVILCGHGPQTDVEYERSNNPYIQQY